MGNWEITATSVVVASSVKINWRMEYQPEDGCKYVKVNMTIKNTGTEVDYFGLYTTAAIVYGDYSYSPTTMIGVNDDISYETVNPLVSVSGFLAFEIPDEVIDSGESLSLVVSDV
ncbi:MAG: DUF4352 domain-containing protein [Oscillospiraceae bacterium]|nr:DUF4352 domain-containing protein [Oscillospiraceae bacterium]